MDIKVIDDDLSVDGDLEIVESDEQHISDIIRAFQGEYKQYPFVGVGIRNYLSSSGKEQEIRAKIKLQLEADGYICKNPTFSIDPSGAVKINPDAIRQ